MGINAGKAKAGKGRAGRLRKLGAAVAAVALLSATSAGVAVPAVADAVGRVARSIDVLGLLSERSPGVREAGAHSNKARRTLVEGSKKGPREGMVPDSTAQNGVAYPRVFDLSADQAPIPAALGLPEDAPPSQIFGTPTGIGALAPVADLVSTPGLTSPTSGNNIIPAGGGGGGGSLLPVTPSNPNPPTPPSPPPPPVPPAVPEPSEWAMMLAAFFLIGGLIRARNGRKAAE